MGEPSFLFNSVSYVSELVQVNLYFLYTLNIEYIFCYIKI